MRVIVAGSRTITSKKMVNAAINMSGYKIDELVSGGARGVDMVAYYLAKEKSVPTKTFYADWKRYGRSAGYIRNREMAEYADALIAIWDGQSRGTKNMIDLMELLDKPYYVFYSDS